MEPFKSLRAVALPIAQPNFDTDQILPARFLQKPRALNFGEFLFRDLRYRADGSEVADFVLNQPAYRPARIVLGEANFGCGSSREHAPWALHDYGIRAVIAPSMGDIFMSNAAKNGLLTIVLPAPAVAGMIEAALMGAITIDKLEAMTCVCSVGLDMIAVPGDTPASTIAAIIADEAAIGMINAKTTAVRIIPAPGRIVGDVVEFGGLLGRAPVMALHPWSSAAFVGRGGRIPAPLQGLGN